MLGQLFSGGMNVSPERFAVIMLGMVLGLFLIIHVSYAVVLFRLCRRFSVDNAWLSFIPGGNIYITVRVAGLPSWYALVVVLSFVPQFGSILFYAAFIYFWWRLLERSGYDGALSLLWILIPVGLIMSFFVAFSKDKREKKKR